MVRSIAMRGIPAVLVVALGGCSFFGIDTRPGIEYATMTERRPVKEPMYQRQIPGTNLVKRWPAQKGLAYGYAPWEKKNDAVMVPNEGGGAAEASAATTAGGAAPSQSSNRSPSARAQAKSAGSQANLAANWSSRHDAEPIKPKSHLKPPPARRVVTPDDEPSSPTGLIQPRTMAPRGAAAHAEVTAADDDAVSPPDQPRFDLPNAYEPSDEQQTPDG